MQKTDLRNLRNEKRLKSALRTLLEEKEFSKITMADIAKQAGVARSTAYVHFENKEECLKTLFYDALDAYISIMNFFHSERADKPVERLLDEVNDLVYDEVRQSAAVYRAVFSSFSYDKLMELAVPRLHGDFYIKRIEPAWLTAHKEIYYAFRDAQLQCILSFIRIVVEEENNRLSKEQYNQLINLWHFTFAHGGGYVKENYIYK